MKAGLGSTLYAVWVRFFSEPICSALLFLLFNMQPVATEFIQTAQIHTSSGEHALLVSVSRNRRILMMERKYVLFCNYVHHMDAQMKSFIRNTG